ncbi:MAG: DUF1015 family protein [Nostocoides sp.]
MADLRPFRMLRPTELAAPRVAAPPYDVVDVAEARVFAGHNPDSFLHVSRPEIDLPDGTPADSPGAHEAGRAALAALVDRGVLVADGRPAYAVYQIRSDVGRGEQTGIVAAATVADYVSGVIATHEQTRPDKEDDRVHHIAGIGAHDEPVFLLAAPREPAWGAVAEVIARVRSSGRPVLSARDGWSNVGGAADSPRPMDPMHVLWLVEEPADIKTLQSAFAAMGTLYVADGHHRSAAAARVAAAHPDIEGTDVFPVVVFPGEELTILPYNRVVADLVRRSPAEFLESLGTAYDVRPVPPGTDPSPHAPGEIAMRLPGGWHRLRCRERPSAADDPVAALDVSLLQTNVLEPLLGITDVRRDPRIGFVGGIRGAAELDRRVDSGTWAAAFLMHPTSVEDLVAVAGSGHDMPPKSTWFEPKLASGLFVHPFGQG